MPELVADSIPCSLFDSSYVADDERVDIWRQGLAPILRSDPLIEDESDFKVQAAVYLVNDCLIGDIRYTPQTFLRNRATPVHDSPDHFMLQMAVDGGYHATNGYRDFTVNPGDIVLYDLGRAITTPRKAHFNHDISLVLSRDEAVELFGDPERYCGVVMPGNTRVAGVIGTSIKNVCFGLGSMDSLSGTRALKRTLSLAAAGFRAMGAGQDEISVSSISTQGHFERICRWIEQNITRPDLSPALICQSAFVSRATLYRLFSHVGGVKAYIHQKRLERCFRQLALGEYGGLPITDIAANWGYFNYPQFSRLFKKRYGITPKDARDVGVAGENITEAFNYPELDFQGLAPEFGEWFAHMEAS